MTASWPDTLSFKTFCLKVEHDTTHLYTQLFAHHHYGIRNQRIAVKKLQIICESTFELANEVGFQAMTLRQLSKQTTMSMGGLYAYIKSKDDLARMIYSFLNSYCEDKLNLIINDEMSVDQQLRGLIYGHIYLSELMQPWFYFAYMETKNLPKEFKNLAIESELNMESKIISVIQSGIKNHSFDSDVFSMKKVQLTAALIKAMLQDWYLKRWKYSKRKVTVDQYAEQVTEITLNYLQESHHVN